MTKQDPAKVKARKDRRRARAEEARMSSRRASRQQSYQQNERNSFDQHVPQERLGQAQSNIFGGDATALEPLSFSRQESGSADLAALSRYNFLDFAREFQANDSSSSQQEEGAAKKF